MYYLDAEAASANVSALMKYLKEAFAEVKCDDNTQVSNFNVFIPH